MDERRYAVVRTCGGAGSAERRGRKAGRLGSGQTVAGCAVVEAKHQLDNGFHQFLGRRGPVEDGLCEPGAEQDLVRQVDDRVSGFDLSPGHRTVEQLGQIALDRMDQDLAHDLHEARVLDDGGRHRGEGVLDQVVRHQVPRHVHQVAAQTAGIDTGQVVPVLHREGLPRRDHQPRLALPLPVERRRAALGPLRDRGHGHLLVTDLAHKLGRHQQQLTLPLRGELAAARRRGYLGHGCS